MRIKSWYMLRRDAFQARDYLNGGDFSRVIFIDIWHMTLDPLLFWCVPFFLTFGTFAFFFTSSINSTVIMPMPKWCKIWTLASFFRPSHHVESIQKLLTAPIVLVLWGLPNVFGSGFFFKSENRSMTWFRPLCVRGICHDSAISCPDFSFHLSTTFGFKLVLFILKPRCACKN